MENWSDQPRKEFEEILIFAIWSNFGIGFFFYGRAKNLMNWNLLVIGI